MRKLILLFFLQCLLFQFGYAQVVNDNNNGKSKAEVSFIGSIKEASTGNPLGFATISFYSTIDSSLIAGGLSEADGTFKIDANPAEMYAIVEFIGFESMIIDPIKIEQGQLTSYNPIVELGDIVLSQSGILMDEVEIRAERSENQFALDKRIFNVGKDLANRGGTAEDILDNVPSVTVDIEGQVSLRGSTGVRILVDGKPSRLANGDNSNSLRQIPADLIERIEVITNPSSRYEAEGMAGIINIVLKKQKRSGFNGSFNGSVGLPSSGGAGASINYRKNKLNWFANYGLNYRRSLGTSYMYQEVYQDDSTFISDQIRDRDRGSLSNSVRAGLDFFIRENESITASFLYKISDEKNNTNLIYEDYLAFFEPQNQLSTSYRDDYELEKESGLQYSLNYHREFSSREHFLDISAQYEDELESQESDLQTQIQYIGQAIEDLNDQRSANDELQKNWLIQMDYAHPFSKDHKFELGLRASLRDITNDYSVEEEISEGNWSTLDDYSDQFIYYENIYAAYAQYGNKFGPISFQAGLRNEYSDVSTALVESDTLNSRNYFNWFPSAFINYELNEGNALQVSYSRRIRRPRFWDLNPFFTFSDNRNLWSGNPNINPSFTDSYELNYLRILENTTFSTGIYYRLEHHPIERIREVTADGTNISIPQNLLKREDYGLETTVSYSGIEWLRLDGNINLYRSIIDGSNVGEGLQGDAYTMDGRLTTRFTLLKGTDVQIRSNYRAPRAHTQGRSKAMGSIDLGISRDFLANKALSLTLSVRDLLNSRKYRYTSVGPTFYTEAESQWRGRTIRLSASYRINQKKSRGGGNDFQGGGDFQGGDL
jgi:outer membrane receptor protein involved in Fe transport